MESKHNVFNLPSSLVGGIIFLVLFLPLCTVLPVAVCQSIGSKHLADTTFPDAYP